MIEEEYVPGHPIDLRNPDQRRRAAKGVFGDEERMVARVVARYYGERVIIADDNSADGMVDIEIHYRDGRKGVLEVTTDPAEEHSALARELIKRNFDLGCGNYLTRVWYLDVAPRCDLRDLAEQAPVLLARLEARGDYFETYTSINPIRPEPTEVRELCKLGVGALCSGPASGSFLPTIRVYPLPSGGPMLDRWDRFFNQLQDVMSNPRLNDVWGKLARRPEADEHHLFFGTTLATDWAINHWLLDSAHELPDRQPVLRPEVDNLWLWNFEFPGRVLAWGPARGWFDPATDWATS